MKHIDNGQLHLLKLASQEQDAEGWAKVSEILWPIVSKLPDDLVEKRAGEDGGHIRLTEGGQAIVRYA